MRGRAGGAQSHCAQLMREPQRRQLRQDAVHVRVDAGCDLDHGRMCLRRRPCRQLVREVLDRASDQ